MKQSKDKLKRSNSRLHNSLKKEQNTLQTLVIDKQWKQSKLDIIIQNQADLTTQPKILRNQGIYTFQNGSIVASHLVHELQKQKILSQQCSISYYFPQRNLYVFGTVVPKLGNYLQNDVQIQNKFVHNKTLKIKVREKKKINIQTLIQEQKQRYGCVQNEDQKNTKGQKQKKICEVVEKVALWRKFYTGFSDQSGNFVQKQLDVAAQEVKIAKKTLDDYLLQIRNGKKYGFNFNQKSNAKIGELRAFVRDQKKKQQKNEEKSQVIH